MGLRRGNGPERLREVVEREYPRDRPGLLAQLRSADADQRRCAARDLAGDAAAAGELGASLVTEQDHSVRDVLFTSLATIADDRAVDALLPLLRSEDANLRNSAIETLAQMPRAVGPRIAALLADLRHQNVTAWLADVLRSEPAVNVVAAAIEVLAEAGQPEHIGPLEAARLRFPDEPFIGFAVGMAISRIEAS